MVIKWTIHIINKVFHWYIDIAIFKIQDVTSVFIKVIHDKFSLTGVYLASFKYDFAAGLSKNIECINETCKKWSAIAEVRLLQTASCEI